MQKLILGAAAVLLAAGCASDGRAVDPPRAAVRPAPAVAVEEIEVVEEVAAEVAVTPVAPVAPDVAERQFALLKGLAGTWVASGAEGSVDGAEIRYEVTSAGHAVVETIFPGAEHEMVSVYHMDNGRLVMTHYCAMGNQPFFTSEAGTAENVIKLTCTGAHNTQSHADPHMHEGVFTIGDGTLHTEWTMFQDLQRGGTVVIDLVRGDG